MDMAFRRNEGPLYVQREATANLLTKLFFDNVLYVSCAGL